MKILTSLLILVASTLFSIPAFAATHTYTFNFKYDYEYGDVVSGDYYNNNAELVNTSGIHAKFYTQAGTLVWSGYTSSSGSVQLTLDDTQKYDILLEAKAHLDDNNYIYIKFSYANPLLHSQWVVTDLQPHTYSCTYNFAYNYNSTYKVSNILAGLSFSLNTKPASASSKSFTAYTQSCNDAGISSCYNCNIQALQYKQNERDHKFVIAHELGHHLEDTLSPGDCFTNDCSFNATDEEGAPECQSSGHCWTSKEYASCAANEGLAHFYSLAVWNDETENDCDFPKQNDPIECEIAHTLMEDKCNTCDPPGAYCCAGKGVEGDWAEFWWGMHSDICDTLTVAEVYYIYIDANPAAWGSSQGYSQLKDSATTLNGVPTSVWNDCADLYGIKHPLL